MPGKQIVPQWLRLKGAATYSSVEDPRTVKAWFNQGLPYSRLPSGLILIKREHLDSFLEGHGVADDRIDSEVDSILEDLKSK